MRLIDYRFLEFSPEIALDASSKISEFFKISNENELSKLRVDECSKDKIIIDSINIQKLHKIINGAFTQSFSRIYDYRKSLVIKSARSCRFIVFEDDGLVRICHCHSDNLIDFEDIRVEVKNSSELLIETDLFDFEL